MVEVLKSFFRHPILNGILVCSVANEITNIISVAKGKTPEPLIKIVITKN